jgi:hypothetical protein
MDGQNGMNRILCWRETHHFRKIPLSLSEVYNRIRMALKFFHLQKAKKFHVPYRFYDPDKEDRDDREMRIKQELGIPIEVDPDKPYTPTLKGQFRQALGRSSKSAEDSRRNSNVRLITLIVILSLVMYLFLR